MDSIDSTFLLIVLSLPPLAIVGHCLFFTKYNELIATHLVLFWAQLYAYGAYWLATDPLAEPSPWTLLLIGAMLIGYFGSFAGFGRLLDRYRESVSLVCLEIPNYFSLFWLALYSAITVYLFEHFGFAAFISSNEIAASAGVPRVLLDIYDLTAYPAWGAFFCCCVRMARRHKVNLIVVVASIAFLGMIMVVSGAGLGAKRQSLLACLVVMFFGAQRPFRPKWSTILTLIVMVPLLIGVWSWYEGIRRNFDKLIIHRQYLSESASEIVSDLTVPSTGDPLDISNLNEHIEKREPPLWFFLKLTDSQLTSGTFAGGALLKQSFENALPGGLMEKQVRHEDELLSDLFLIRKTDYPVTLLAVFQAETFVAAAILAPLTYIFLFWIYLHLLVRQRLTINTLESKALCIVIIGVLINEAGAVQVTLTTLVCDFRNVIVFAGLAWVASTIRQITRTLSYLEKEFSARSAPGKRSIVEHRPTAR